MKRIAFVFLCLFTSSALVAQNEDQQINNIKRNKNYVYATATSSVSEEDAAEDAKELLSLEIQDWLKTRGENDVVGYVAKSNQKISQINTKKGRLFRVFAFVRKKEVLPFYEEEDVIVVDFNKPVDSVPDSAASSQQTVEAIPSSSNNTTSVAERVEEESVADNVEIETPLYVPTAFEKEMIEVTTFKELQSYVSSRMENKTILVHGKYTSLPQTGLVYAFVYNKEGGIEAVIRRDDERSVNLKTGSDDAIKNYSGCGAIWIKTK